MQQGDEEAMVLEEAKASGAVERMGEAGLSCSHVTGKHQATCVSCVFSMAQARREAERWCRDGIRTRKNNATGQLDQTGQYHKKLKHGEDGRSC